MTGLARAPVPFLQAAACDRAATDWFKAGSMANTKSAKKAVRKIESRTSNNRARRSEMRTYVRKVEEALTAGDVGAATAALKTAEPIIMRAAQKGIVHKNSAARKVSRLTTRLKTLTK